MKRKPLRVVTFNYLPVAYNLLAAWIGEAGHKHVLAVTTPGPKSRPTPTYKGVVEAAPRNVDVLVTTRLRRVATPLIRELKPDLIACFSFPYRITPELCAIPTYGAVNLHPTVLPAYRGPNVMRQFYEGGPVFGATAHWIAEDYDTGHILSQKSAPMPDEVTREAILPVWGGLMSEALREGMERAIAGHPGTAQDHSQASYAAPFTEQEHWLDWNDPQRVIQRKATSLNLLGPGQARANVDGDLFKVMALHLLSDQNSSHAPGTCIERHEQSMVIQVADGVIRIQVQPLAE